MLSYAAAKRTMFNRVGNAPRASNTTISDLHPVHPENPVHPVTSSRRHGCERCRRHQRVNLLFKTQCARGAMPARLNIVRRLRQMMSQFMRTTGRPGRAPGRAILRRCRNIGICYTGEYEASHRSTGDLPALGASQRPATAATCTRSLTRHRFEYGPSD